MIKLETLQYITVLMIAWIIVSCIAIYRVSCLDTTTTVPGG